MFFHFNHYDRALNQTTTAMGGTDVIGQSGLATATSYSFSEGYTFKGYDEWLTVQNPTNNLEAVWVTLINGKGTVYSFPINVLAHSRYTLNINEIVFLRMLHPGDGTAGYRNPSAKAPVIDPWDEAPFLVWRGEVERRGAHQDA